MPHALLNFLGTASLDVFAARVYSHAYMTSLNAPGFSISILNASAIYQRLSENSSAKVSVTVHQILSYLDAPTDASGWLGVRSWPSVKEGEHRDRNVEEEETESLLQSLSAYQSGDKMFRSGAANNQKSWEAINLVPVQVEKGVRSACEAVFTVESELTKFDTEVGDGDCGTTFANGARGSSMSYGSLSRVLILNALISRPCCPGYPADRSKRHEPALVYSQIIRSVRS